MSVSVAPMFAAVPKTHIIRFGVFEVDLQARELRKRGLRLKLQQKPFQLLELLLERPGELVTRKQVAERLWPGIHVSFDRSLNTAVNALRRALSDSPRNPRFLETRSGLGYRFIGAIERIDVDARPNEPARHIDCIAVLPFANESGDPTMEYFSESLAEHIIATLSTIDRLRVVARSNAFRFRGPDVDAASAGRQLNAGAVVTGRVSRYGAVLTVAAELMDVQTGWRLWGERYQRAAADVAALESDISCDVARQLRGRIDDSHRGAGASAFEAYQDYLKGRYFFNKLTEDALRQSVAYFESALEQDRRFPLAYSGLADAYAMFAFLDLMPAREAFARARELALAAIRLDDQLAEGHASLASVMRLHDWDWTGAEAEYRRALVLNPNSAAARQNYASHLCSLGKSEQALEQLRRAQELDPLSLPINNEMAWTYYMSGDFEAALQQAWKTLALEPRFPAAQHTLGLANQQLGNFEDAIVELRNAYVCSGNHPTAQASLACALAVAGESAEAHKHLDALTEAAHRRYISPYCLALIQTGFGNGDAACDLLERGIQDRDVWMVWLPQDPRFTALRPLPRFRAFTTILTAA